MGGRRLELNQGIQRHNEQSAHHAHQQECRTHGEGTSETGKYGDAYGYTHGANGYQPGLDVIARCPARQQRAAHDTHTGAGQDALDHHGIGDIQRFLGERRERRQHHLRDRPERRQPDDGQPYRGVLVEHTEVALQVAQLQVGRELERVARAALLPGRQQCC